MSTHDDKLWRMVVDNQYPATDHPIGTLDTHRNLIQQLANSKDPQGISALQTAVHFKTLPPNTTLADLQSHPSNRPYFSILDYALSLRNLQHLPPNTTAHDLAQCQIKHQTALHVAASNGTLPPDTTAELLKNTQGTNRSAWDSLLHYLTGFPHKALDLDPKLFCNDHPIAIQFVDNTIADIPALHSAAAIWLGKVFAPPATKYPMAKN